MTKHETYTIADIAIRLGKSETTVRGYIKSGMLGVTEKKAHGMYKLPAGAIGNLIIQLEESEKEKKRRATIQKGKRNGKTDNKKLSFIPRYSQHEAEDLAKSRMEEEVSKHVASWSRDLNEDEIEFRRTTLYRDYLHKLLSETDGVPREELSEAERRVALQAPIFMTDALSRMSPDDMSYFLSELKSYYDLGYEIDSDPRLSFIVNQIILEQMRLRHRQTLSFALELSVDKDTDEAMGRSMTMLDKLFKMLGSHGEPTPPTNGDKDSDAKSDEYK